MSETNTENPERSAETNGVARTESNSLLCRFAPDDCGHYAVIHVVETDNQAKELLEEWEIGNHGLMFYDHNIKGDHRSTIVILRKHLSIPLMVHEISHAAIEWVNGVSMPAAIEGGENDLDGYYSECLARVMEFMTADGLDIFA